MVKILQSFLLMAIDPWIPPRVAAQSSQRSLYRFLSSVLVGTLLYLVVLALITQVLTPLNQAGKALIQQFSLGLTLGILASLLTLRFASKHYYALHTFIATLTSGLVYVTCVTGGVDSPAILCSVIIPALATLSIGARAGIGWGLAICAIGAAMYFIEQFGFRYIDITSPGNRRLAEFASVLTSHAFILFIAVYYELNNRKLSRKLRREQSKYFHLAHHDSLTGIANRRHFMDAINSVISQSRRSKDRFSVLYFDLNNFKQANDTYGHHFGDKVLVTFADRLRSEVREDDFVARLGGDEFALLLPTLGRKETVEQRLDALIQRLSEPMYIEGITYRLTASVGYAIYPDHGSNDEELLKVADQSMYVGKRRDRRGETRPLDADHQAGNAPPSATEQV